MRPTDGPDRGKSLRLERWQIGIVNAIDREQKPIVAIRAAAQCGKTMISLGCALRAAVEGQGVLLASATETSIRDLSRRLEAVLEAAPDLAAHFPSARSGPGARASWKEKRLDGGGWLGMAAAGSASQLASRTAAIAIADEVSRFPANVRSLEGHPLALLRARLIDYGDDGRLLALSSPVHQHDAISLLWRDGDRRRLEYPCPHCRALTPLLWDHVTGRKRDQNAGRGVRGLRCRAPRTGPADDAPPRSVGRTTGRAGGRRFDQLRPVQARQRPLDPAGNYARMAPRPAGGREGGYRRLKVFRNLVLGLPSDAGGADVDRLYERRESRFDLTGLEQVTGGIDVQNDRLVYVVLGWSPDDIWVLAHGTAIGDPRDDAVWTSAASAITTTAGPLPASIVSVDAGYLTSAVRDQCRRRRWWIPTVGRPGEAVPLARPLNRQSGIATMGTNDSSAYWAGRIDAGRVHFPQAITRPELAELAAAEALTAEGGALKWRPLPGRTANHRWDAARLAIHARHFRTLRADRQPFRVVTIGA